MTQDKSASTPWADALIDGLLPVVNVATDILNVSAARSFFLNGCLPDLIAKVPICLCIARRSLVLARKLVLNKQLPQRFAFLERG